MSYLFDNQYIMWQRKHHLSIFRLLVVWFMSYLFDNQYIMW